MRKKGKRRFLAVALVAAVASGGCFGLENVDFNNPMDVFMLILGGAVPTAKQPTSKLDSTVDLLVEGSIGGLSGDYDLTFSEQDGDTFGTLTGTTTVKKGRFITIKDKGSEELKAIVAAIAERQIGGGTVTITKCSGKIKGSQTPGGVESVFKFTGKFKGTVSGGPRDGAVIKKGKLATSGTKPNF